MPDPTRSVAEPAAGPIARPLPAAAWPRWLLVVLVATLAFAFLGTRGIWDPDEGRYTNVALNMMDSGDWVDLQRNHHTGHWTKPPLTYWAIAASASAFGRDPWAARLPMALAYLACAWLTALLARRLAPGGERVAALAFATMLLPFGASQLVTTDFVLAAFQTLAMYAYVESRMGDARHSARWVLAMWLAFALAFLTKGPPGLIALLGVVAFEKLVPQRGRASLFAPLALVAFAAVAMPWFLVVSNRHPGLLEHFIGSEVVERVATNRFGRNGEWYGWLQVYLPTLLVGTLPWTFVLWRWMRGEGRSVARWRDAEARRGDAPVVLLVAWIVVPLVVFCIARSRLPLYILALFVPLALLVARQWVAAPARIPSLSRVAVWCALLVALKLAGAHWTTHKDAEAWADAIRDRAPFPVHEVVFVDDMARYGLNLHLGAQIEKLSSGPVVDSEFNPEYDETLADELAEGEGGVIYVAKQEDWGTVRHNIVAAGYRVNELGTPFEGRVLFDVARRERASLGAVMPAVAEHPFWMHYGASISSSR
ncbi:MAG TPA: glycosyltransferase family 39 protein [Xanthomonadales bacterium]|nr:glycosyltransferase family 39 protein [Xanthomonadales bacterium]